MKISEIYNQVKIPQNLQLHMVRVAAVAKIILDGWINGGINKDVVIKACLFHDIGKLVSFDMEKWPLNDDIGDNEFWKKAQKEMMGKYGKDEPQVAEKICREFGLGGEVIRLLEEKSIKPLEKRFENFAQTGNYELKIVHHSDSRISPEGLVTLKDRAKELLSRLGADEEKRKLFEYTQPLAEKVQAQIQEKVTIGLDSIDNSELEKVAKELLEYEI